MEAAAGALSPVLRKLGELLVGEYNLEKRVKKGVQSLITELEMMHAVLREVGKVPSDQLQEPVRIWAGKVRDLSCDMEDVVDDFLVRVEEGSRSKPTNMRNRVRKFLKKTTKLFGKGKALHQISDAIKEAQDLAKELADLRKRYLIVIDDVWKEDVWRYINCALNKNKLHSRVITTTRNLSVSEACLSSGDDIIHKMKPLSDEDSQILFHRRIFQSEEKCPEDLQIVSRDILKKCGGVPLAIITIASLLATNQEVNKKDEWIHVHNSMGLGITQGGIVKDMKRILSLSYYDLPCHLKTCLLYLSIFPEDFEIEKDCLIWRWVAEGFIQCDKGKSRLFEIGESFFNELLNRSLIQPAEINNEGVVVTCRIHDMVLELICSLSIKENFTSILDNVEWHAPNLQRKFRRLSLHNIKAKCQEHQLDSTILSKVRTFAVFSPVTCDWLPSLSSFQFLRVLDLGNCGSNESSSGINLKYVGNLIHLRYLGLKNADVCELSVDIGKLQLLQTLDIKGTGIKELPASFVLLRNLICLYIDDDDGLRLPKGMGNLTSLEVLDIVNLSLSPHMVKDLSHLICQVAQHLL